MWHTRTILVVLMGVSLVLVPGLRADSLQLKNGNFVQGRYLGGTERAVQFEANGKIRVYDIGEILSISFAAASADGGVPSNDDEQKFRTSTGLNSIDRDHNAFHTAPVNQMKRRTTVSQRRSLTQNDSRICQDPEGRTGGYPHSKPVQDSELKARIARISERSIRVGSASSSVLSD